MILELTLILSVSSIGQEKIVRLLIEKGADVNAVTTEHHFSAVMFAVFIGDISNMLARLLLQ